MVEPLSPDELRWRLRADDLPFRTTEEVEPIAGVIGQSSAVEALRFGLETDAPGQNVFIRGLTGTGRLTLVRRLLEELQPTCAVKYDRCYVHNFSQPERPRLITLTAGRARNFRRLVHEMAEFVREGLADALNAEATKARRESLERRAQQEMEAVSDPFERDLKKAGLALVSLQMGPVSQTTIFPTHEGKPVPPEEYEELKEQGKVTQEQFDAYRKGREDFQKRLEEVTGKVRQLRRRSSLAVQAVVEGTARAILGDMGRDILGEFNDEEVRQFLSEVIDDVVEHRLRGNDNDLPDPVQAYGVNILIEHEDGESCPIVLENTPTLVNLLGIVDREWTPRGPAQSDYRRIRAGSLLRADGGYLILDARDILGEPGAWKVLLRTLRNGRLEIVPPEMHSALWTPSIKPEPIPIQVKVILIGDSYIYYLLDQHDPDFADHFKCLVDFDSVIDREPDAARHYAGVLARIAAEEGLPPYDRTAVAALTEHGARVAARRGKVTARFARIADIAREAAFLARKRGEKEVIAADVHHAINRTRQRADLPSRRFRELLADGTIRVRTQGEEIGQINGLAVISAGPITYGFPARITASIGPGSAGIINIEGQAQLSGSIHTKGFHILGGLLRHLLQTDHPLAFSASLAFEQSYGGIDGDSASGAEICCLLSALTRIPIRQSFAMTGAIDQVGHLQAIGGVNEKIEGFFDTCNDIGLTGDQGVIIPRANAGDLMLRDQVADAAAEGKFHVYAVDTVQEALEVLTGMEAGERDEEGYYPEGTVLAHAVEEARDFWEKSSQNPVLLAAMEAEAEGEEEEPVPPEGIAVEEDEEQR